MALNANLLLAVKEPEVRDPIDLVSKAMSLRQAARQGEVADRQLADDKALRDAYSANTSVGPDGKMAFNREGVVSTLQKANPLLAVKQQAENRTQESAEREAKFKQLTESLEVQHQLTMSIPIDGATPQEKQAAWTQMTQTAKQYQLPNSDKLPDIYPGDAFVRRMQLTTMKAKEHVDQQNKDREFAQKEREINAKKTGEGGKMTEAQSKSLGFGRRAMLADQMLERVMSDPKADVSSLKTQIKSALPKWMGGMKDQREQDITTAKLGFIASVLRKESGAAVTPEEFGQYDRMYFPQPGDSPDTQADKSILRRNFIDTEKMSAGSAWRDPIPLQTRKEKAPPPPAAGETKVWQGVTYKVVDGHWVPQ